MVIFFAACCWSAASSLPQLNIEAYPDPVPPLVEVITQSTGQSAEEIERYITIPIEIQLAGIPQRQGDPHDLAVRPLRRARSSSPTTSPTKRPSSGSSTGSASCRRCPAGRSRSISPDQPDRRDLPLPGGRAARLFGHRSEDPQDWILERRFKAVPGVIDVTGWGGKTKTYDVTIDQSKLVAYGLTLPQVLQALNNSNVNVGGQTVNFGAAVGGGARRRPDPHAGRHPQHHAHRQQRHAGADQATSPPSASATSRGWASPARTTTTTSSRASC